MSRSLYLAGWGYVLIALALVGLRTKPAPDHPLVGRGAPVPHWFAATKPFCNPLEVELRLQAAPPPAGADGAGYAAACWAMAGKIERARQVIDELAEPERARAAGIVFEIGHPIADAGDDLSAGPIMQLVVHYQPWNYMALYHAGVSLHAIGRNAEARQHLVRFLELYDVHDGWRSNAETVLKRMGPEVEL